MHPLHTVAYERPGVGTLRRSRIDCHVLHRLVASAPHRGAAMSEALIVPEWFQDYRTNQHLTLVSYPLRTNGPTEQGWLQRGIQEPEPYREDRNWGAVLGVELEPGKYLADVDFNWADGVRFARFFLPPTGFGFGHGARRLTHRFYTTSTPLATKQYKDIDGRMLVEVRGTNTDGLPGFQTMVPPSIHPDDGPLEFVNGDRHIAHADNLPHCITAYAIACLLIRRVLGRLHHDGRLALAGFLLRHGFDAEHVIRLLEAICAALITTRGPNMSDTDVTDCRYVVESTAQRLAAKDKNVAGGPAFAAFCGAPGPDIVARITTW